ncbi:MAG: response regulator transcription factor [Synechococcus sp. SB0668_bin_15]|nr:response regulator transcription factor [Synechococcus sp. SB0668_bin_15]MXZ82520.1 response regulator transcription factor [Synechococcus sp. SB0666_bin_14]MYC49922.1 response regulator transcription factor [Synechococcus sp. SB0662_bin_14]MYG47126.1 response regulator transcription factor [Synechococcus sp. SB0675_bin_6]MYJ59227.1 response regulator transcription factor [Synechococcus sp. SB0672_bin_6]MYK92007.1 response regulator transcription factor [Synechococcus sp. SB0669_bin_8]
MLLCTPPLQASTPVPNRSQWAEPFAGISMVVVCDRQDILSLVLIGSVVLFPQALNLELSTCATHGLALVRARQPQLLVCIEPLAEGDTLALVSQAKRLPAAPKILLIRNSTDSQLFPVTVETYCDGILGADAADAGTVFQALRIVAGGDTYRDYPVTTASSQGGNGFNRPQGDRKLTARERQVLELIVRGCSNQEISRQLHVGPSTVKTHVSRLLDKLDARDRTQAAVRAIALGLAPWPPGEQTVRPAP